jgi:uncharacterized repeat protein (TIGR03803 family)
MQFRTLFTPGLAIAGTLFLSSTLPAPVEAQSFTIDPVATFNGINGQRPDAGVVFDGSGNLFGTTEYGGAKGYGTVFEIAAGTNTITNIASFNGSNGLRPTSNVTIDSSGNLYGTTFGGGNGFVAGQADGTGTLYKIAAGTNTISTLFSFDTNSTGKSPFGGLTFGNDGDLYGTTGAGGSAGSGTVFRLNTTTNALTSVANFNNLDGSGSHGTVIFDNNGNLYGTTVSGGTSNLGAVYKIAAGTSTITALASFTGSNGSDPEAGLTIDGAGNLYGTTTLGGANNFGTIFKIAAGTSAVTTLYSFDVTSGSYPRGGLTLDTMGNLFGTASAGGASGGGIVYKFSLNSNGFTSLANFPNTPDSNSPFGPVKIDSHGYLYGTASGATGGNGNCTDGACLRLYYCGHKCCIAC